MTAWLPVFEIFNVRTYYVQACDCTWGLYRHCRVCTGNCQGEKYPAASDFLSFIWKSSRLICSNTVYYHDDKYILKLSMHTHTEACTHAHSHTSLLSSTHLSKQHPPPHTHTHKTVCCQAYIYQSNKPVLLDHKKFKTVFTCALLFYHNIRQCSFCLHVCYFSIRQCLFYLHVHYFPIRQHFIIFIYMCVTFLYYQAALNYIHLHVRYFSILSGST